MSFSPQNTLEKSLIQAANDPTHRPQFYKDLAEANFFIIQAGPAPEQSGQTTLEQGAQLRIQHIEFEGKSVIPVFSSIKRIESFIQEKVGYIGLNALEFMKITLGAELILNPGSDYGKAFNKEEIASIINGRIWEPQQQLEVKKDTKVMIGQPANYPTELATNLTRHFKKIKQVKKAYLAHFMNPEVDEKPHTIIALEVSEDYDSIMAEIGMIASNTTVPDPPVDIIRLTGKGGIEDYFTSECKPFYQRRVFNIF